MKLSLKHLSILLILFSLLTSSCSTGKSYADRKNRKYRTKSVVVKSERKKKNRTYTSTSKNKVQGVRADVLAQAKKHIGKKYVYGGKTSSGFDCSGFTSYVFNKAGISLTGPSYIQSKQGNSVRQSNTQAGDLLFFGSKGKVTHVAIVVESSPSTLQIIHSTSSRGVVLEDIKHSEYWHKRYLFARDVVGSGYASR